MKKSEQSLNESIEKIIYLMGYDAQMTRSENQDILEEQEDDIDLMSSQDKPNCPNAIPFFDVVKQMKKIAHIVRRMNTVFVRMVGSTKRVQYIYRTIKSLQGKNTYAEDFDECVPAIPAAISFFNGYFSDWFSKGESFEEELSQLIRRRYYRNDPISQRYLKETLKIVQSALEQSAIDKNNRYNERFKSTQDNDTSSPAAMAAKASGYKFVKGTSDDPYKYGTLGSGIAQVQQNLGVVQDGKWGPKTDAKMKELAPEYTGGYTNDDLVKIIQAIRLKKNPALQKSTAPTAPTLAPKTPMKLAPMAQQIQPTKKELRKLVRLRT